MYLCHNFECLVSTQSTFKKGFLRARPESNYILKVYIKVY